MVGSKKSNDYLESLFTGIDTIIEKRLETLSYDTTIVCTVVDHSNSKNGEYKVSNGEVIYTAYSDSAKYSSGDSVRVSIPMGDFSQKKFIVGKYTTDNDSSPITYVSPMDTIVNISGNLVENKFSSSGIAANGDVQSKVIWNKSLDDQSFKALQDNNIYNTIILKADFKTLFNNYDLIDGNYGLRLDFLIKPSSESSVNIRRFVTLDSSEMFGNPYCFSIYSPQAKVVKLNTIGLVTGIELSLYQKGNFTDRDQGIIVPIRKKDQIDDILVKNIVISMGCDLENLEDNTLQLYTENDQSYRYTQNDNSTNLKKMGLLWLNKDDLNQYVGFSDGVYDYDYDELDYLEKAKGNTRLINQIGREGIPNTVNGLTLAANIEEAQPLINSAIKVVDQEIISLLRDLCFKVDEVSDYVTNITNAIDGVFEIKTVEGKETSVLKTKGLTHLTAELKTYLSNSEGIGLVQQYEKVLNYTYEIQNSIDHKEAWNDNWVSESYGKKITANFKTIINNIENLLSPTGGFNKIKTSYSGLKGIYDSYVTRINKQLIVLKGYLKWLSTTELVEYGSYQKDLPSGVIPPLADTIGNPSDFKLLKNLGRVSGEDVDKTTLNVYKEEDLSKYDNRYCIYWFRYEKDYQAPAAEKLLPDGWRRLTLADYKSPHSVNDSDKKNIGLSSLYLFSQNDKSPYCYTNTQNYIEDEQYYTQSLNATTKKYVYTKATVNEENWKKDKLSYFVKACANDKGQPVHAPKPVLGKGFLNRYMQYDLEDEKYMAVLFYNHTMYKSNELVFKNLDPIPDRRTQDQGDILYLEHLNNSSNSYQVYNQTTELMNGSDEHLIRQVRCHYDGVLAKDNAFVNGRIYWTVPINSTMLTVDVDDLTEKGFSLDNKKSKMSWAEVDFQISDRVYEPGVYYINDSNNKKKICDEPANDENDFSVPDPEISYYEKVPGVYVFYKKIEAQKLPDSQITEDMQEWDKWDYTNKTSIDNRDFWYKIKKYYSQSAKNNTISCMFVRDKDNEEDAVYGEELFNFGIRGTSGTKYTLAIEQRTGQSASNGNKGLPLQAVLKDFDNKVLDFNEIENFDGSWIGYSKRTGTDEAARIAMNNLNTTSNGATFNTPKGVYGLLKLTGKITLKGTELKDRENEKTQVGKTREVDLNVVYPIPYASDSYFMDGPTTIVYNGLGALDNLSMYNNPYKLFAKKEVTIKSPYKYKDRQAFNKDKDKKYKYVSDSSSYQEYTGEFENANTVYYKNKKYKPEQQITDVDWSIIYRKAKGTYNEWDTLDNTAKDKDDGTKYPTEKEFCSEYMPVVQNGHLVPSPMYMTDLNCYAIVIAKVGETIYWRQPIAIVQNKYGSSMLNDWDGTFTIDKTNGTIMGTMFGAGKKTGNNTFEGVLMGDVATGAGISFQQNSVASIGLNNHCGMGVYGFNDGVQSFGLNSDGTAFFGKSGKGRIIFNGNHGVIASQNWFKGAPEKIDGKIQYPHPGEIKSDGTISSSNAGMCIDLDSGHIDAYNFKLTSKNIYLNSTPSTMDKDSTNKSYYFRIGGDGTPFYGQIGQDKEPTRGYIGLTEHGELSIRVNKLSITEQLGSANLLSQTAPTYSVLQYKMKSGVAQTDDKGNYLYQRYSKTDEKNKVTDYYGKKVKQGDLKYFWNVDSTLQNPKPEQKWTARSNCVISGAEVSRKKYLEIKAASGKNPSTYSISQEVTDLEEGKDYTISGYVRLINDKTNTTDDFTASLKDSSSSDLPKVTTSLNTGKVKNDQLSKSKWRFFEKNVNLNSGTTIKVTFSYKEPFQIYHAKLEQSSVASEWSLSAWDIENNINTTRDNFNEYLSQDQIFNDLAINPETGKLMNGIWLEPNSYTGATELYISATYIATGILRSANFDGTIRYNSSETNRAKQYSVSGGTAGMYINLNDGFVWAKEFTLKAGKQNGVIEINSDPGENGNYFYVGAGDSDYMKFHTLKSGTDVIKKLELKATNFTLKAGAQDTGLVEINSDPGTSGNYFYIGDSNDFIKFTKTTSADGKTVTKRLSFEMKNFKLKAGTSPNQIIINSGSKTTPLQVGPYFSVTWEGKLTANQASIDGILKAGAGSTIGGWTIYKDRIEGGTLKLHNTGEIENTSKKFGVTSAGVLSATGATLTSLTIIDSLSVNKNADDKNGNVFIAGKTEISGGAWLHGDIYVNTTSFGKTGVSSSPGTLYIRGGVNIDSKITIAGYKDGAAATTIYAAGLTNNTSGLLINGHVRVTGKSEFNGQIFVKNGENYLGAYANDKVKSFKVGSWSPVYLTFRNGILVGATKKKDDVENIETGDAADFDFPNSKGKDGQVLKSDGKGGSYWGTDNTGITSLPTDKDTHGSFWYQVKNDVIVKLSATKGTGDGWHQLSLD